MKEKRFTLFWKKLIIMNLGLALILFRIFGMIYEYLTKKSSNISIFPTYTENGYPFFDSINCDIKDLAPIIDSMTTGKQNTSQTSQNSIQKDNLVFNSFINILKSQQCSFYDELNICKDNKKCFNELNNIIYPNDIDINNNISYSYHLYDNEGKLKISNLIQIFQNKNEFINKFNNQIEIEPYYQLISGYYSYLNIKLYEQKNKKNFDILREVTNYEDKVNNLLYFHSLFLKAHSIIYKNKVSPTEDSIKYINQCLKESQDQFTDKKSLFYTSEKIRTKIIEIIENELYQIINCIPDFNKRYSYSVDIQAIKIMLKTLLGLKENFTINDKKIFNFYLKELSKSIKNLFIADVLIRQKAGIFETYQPYFIIIFISISIGGLIFTNRYFIKNKEYYSESQILAKYKRDKYNFEHNSKHHQYWRRIKEMEEKKKEEEMKKKQEEDLNKNNNEGKNMDDNNKCTKEELEYIEKLAKEHKGDFILTK